MLIALNLESGSGSERYEVGDLYYNKNSDLVVQIRYISNEKYGTCDMAYWEIVVEILKKDYNGGDIKMKFGFIHM